jgi:hypothetical protein
LSAASRRASLYQTLPPYQQREGIRLVIANVKISEDALEISILGRPAPEEVLEKLRAPGIHSPRRSERSTWLPGLMSQERGGPRLPGAGGRTTAGKPARSNRRGMKGSPRRTDPAGFEISFK